MVDFLTLAVGIFIGNMIFEALNPKPSLEIIIDLDELGRLKGVYATKGSNATVSSSTNKDLSNMIRLDKN